MEKAFQLLEKTRNNIISSINDLTTEELNIIPEGFNNNIAWNIGHLIVTQQILCYKLSNLDIKYPEKLTSDFRKGTKPSQKYEVVDMAYFKKELLETIEELRKNYEDNIFKEYTSYETSYGVVLNNIEDAIEFNNLHEALHFGYILALKRAVKK